MISVSAHAAVVCARVPHLHCLSQCLERGSRFVTSGRPRARALLRAILRRKFGAAARVGQACSIILAASRVHGAVPQTSRGGEAPAPTSARRRVACQASTAPLLRTRARHTTWRAIPHCRDVRQDWSRTEWPATKKKLCSTCVDHERAESRSAISKPIFADADAKGPLRAAGKSARRTGSPQADGRPSPVQPQPAAHRERRSPGTSVGHAEKRRAWCRHATHGGVASAGSRKLGQLTRRLR
jgi:hypothetical protein